MDGGWRAIDAIDAYGVEAYGSALHDRYTK
jgi:hypothetical protein